MVDTPMQAEMLEQMLRPEGAPLSDPAQIERALAVLWDAAGGPAQAADPSVTGRPDVATRVCLANLIVIGDAADWHGLDGVLGELSSVYPARMLVLLSPSGNDADSAAASPGGLRAFVTAICHVPQPNRPQVCCEQIVLHSDGPLPAEVDRTLLPMLESDVPTVLWWLSEVSDPADLLSALQRRADRCILDCGPGGLRVLSAVPLDSPRQSRARSKRSSAPRRGGPGHLTASRAGVPRVPGCAVRELGWYRSARWREVVAGMFDGLEPAATLQIDTVEIRLAGPDSESRLEGLWLAAFLGGQLGWTPQDRNDSNYLFTGPAGPVRVEITTDLLSASRQNGPAGIIGVSLRRGESLYEIRPCGQRAGHYRVVLHDAHICQLPRTMQIPRLSTVSALIAAMTGRSVDKAFDRAAPLAAWMASDD